MKTVTNLIVGFLVSLVGSLPLGYINITALQIFRVQGISGLVPFLAGIIIVEFLLVLLILKGSKWLIHQEKLMFMTELISIGFMVFLAISFYNDSNSTISQSIKQQNFVLTHPPLILGLLLNAANLVQVPFWAGWNVYLINAEYIHVGGNRKYAYVTGTSLGTFGGILLFVMLFESILMLTNSEVFISFILTAICLVLATIQCVKCYRKYKLLK